VGQDGILRGDWQSPQVPVAASGASMPGPYESVVGASD
jgi:hypothetical protein